MADSPSPRVSNVSISWGQLFGFLTVVATIIAGTWALDQNLHGIDLRLAMIEDRIADRWRGVDMELWSERLGRENPELKIPSVEQIRRGMKRND